MIKIESGGFVMCLGFYFSQCTSVWCIVLAFYATVAGCFSCSAGMAMSLVSWRLFFVLFWGAACLKGLDYWHQPVNRRNVADMAHTSR